MSDFKPLDGIRAVELSHMIMGPSCGMFLAFLGAEVIKVEPLGGDKTRRLTGMGASFFPLFNRGKKSVEIDLETSNGKDALNAIIGSSDVLVENFRDASLNRMGLRPDDLRKRFPRLIVVSCKGFLRGPYEHRPALDEVVQMATGLAYMTGPAGRPLRVGSSANDIMAGLFGACGVLGALRERESTGSGREFRVGLFENSLLLVAQHMVQFALTGTEPPPMPDKIFSWPVYDIFRTKDEIDMFIGVVTEGQWSKFCRLLGLEKFIANPGLQSKVDQIEARPWTMPIIRQAVAEMASRELARKFEAHDIPFAPIAKPSEMYDDPHVNREGGLVTSNTGGKKSFSAPGMPYEVDGLPDCRNMDVPALGADTLETLRSLGLDGESIAKATRRNEKGETG
ncbi:MAG: CoA transferase [Albidovulum sp.]|nr:CoA transferase [Albidovulum sp.]